MVTDISNDSKNSRAYRAARLAVIILTTLLVLGVGALVVGFVRQYRIYSAARQQAHPPAGAVPAGAAATVTLAPGARILSADVAAGRLVLRVATPSGGEVEIVDLKTGRLVGQVKTRQ